MRIAVAGATGVVGHPVVDRARERGHEAVSLARSLGIDLAGQERNQMVDLTRRYVRATGSSRTVLGLRGTQTRKA